MDGSKQLALRVVSNFALAHTLLEGNAGRDASDVVHVISSSESRRYLKMNLSFALPMLSPIARMCGTSSS